MSRTKSLKTLFGLGVGIVTGLCIIAVQAESIDPDNDESQYAWSENTGWINAEPQGDGGVGVQVEADKLTGYMWGENVGWISLSCLNQGTCATLQYGVLNDGAGNLTGFSWGENVGWISFSCTNTSSCGTVNYGVTIDPNTGEFSGFAWGENIGWMSFSCTNTNSCATIDYGIKTQVVDSTPPETAILSAIDGNGDPVPNGGSTLSTAITFTFQGTDAVGVDHLECSLDGSAFIVCVSPRNLISLAAASHTFQVRAVDSTGNTDASPATFDWTVLTSVEATQNLIAEIGDLGLPRGVQSSLLGPIKRIEKLLTDSKPDNDAAVCGKLDEFSATVSAKESAGKLTSGQATDLRQAAQAIKVNQGCP